METFIPPNNYIEWSKLYHLKELDWLLKKVEGKQDTQILAGVREPETECKSFLTDKRFKFYGYDLLEEGNE